MLGLAELYQHVRTAALKQKCCQAQSNLFLTPEMLAYYLLIRYRQCRQFMQTSSTYEFKRYGICIRDTQQLFIGDVLLFLSQSRMLKYRHKRICHKIQHPKTNESKYNTSDLPELLQKSAVEHLTIFRYLEAQEFGSLIPIVTTDFEAMYAYKCGDYQRCLQLSTQQMRSQFLTIYMPDVSILPEFIQLMDDDIVSLTALIRMTYPYCCPVIGDLALSLYLMTQCQLKLRHSVSSLSDTIRLIKLTLPAVLSHRSIDSLAEAE